MYSEETLKRFRNPKFAGEMKNPDAIGEEGNMKCGDVMKIYIKVKDNKISDIKFQTYGCMAAIAASDLVCELALGKTLDEAYVLDYKKIVAEQTKVPSIKIHCSVLGTLALKNAINNYRKTESKALYTQTT